MYNTSTCYGQGSTYSLPSVSYQSNIGYNKSSQYTRPEYRPLYVAPTAENFEARTFLREERPNTAFIKCADEVKDLIEEAFLRVTGTEFPKEGIQITILARESFKRVHDDLGKWSEGIMGFSINRYGKGVSEIFVRENNLDELMLTIGHEIGHVMSNTLPDKRDEEAKAHAFSIAWMEKVQEFDIGGLRKNIALNPARNGIHDVALDHVRKLLNSGMEAIDIFKTLSKGLMSMIAEVS